jgi:hypothetical protein
VLPAEAAAREKGPFPQEQEREQAWVPTEKAREQQVAGPVAKERKAKGLLG